MTDDPFASWGTHMEDTRLRNAARRLAVTRANELAAQRNYNEAISYYSGGQWSSDGVNAQELDALLNQLTVAMDASRALRQSTEDELNTLVASLKRDGQSPALFRDQLLQKARSELDQQADLTVQSPLDDFLSTRRKPQVHDPDDEDNVPSRKKARRR